MSAKAKCFQHYYIEVRSRIFFSTISYYSGFWQSWLYYVTNRLLFSWNYALQASLWTLDFFTYHSNSRHFCRVYIFLQKVSASMKLKTVGGIFSGKRMEICQRKIKNESAKFPKNNPIFLKIQSVYFPWSNWSTKIRSQAKIDNFAFKNSNIIIEGLIWRWKDYFSWKKFETQKIILLINFIFGQTYFLIASS